jgi:hypothetical protein
VEPSAVADAEDESEATAVDDMDDDAAEPDSAGSSEAMLCMRKM